MTLLQTYQFASMLAAGTRLSKGGYYVLLLSCGGVGKYF